MWGGVSQAHFSVDRLNTNFDQILQNSAEVCLTAVYINTLSVAQN
jgi:hypothetical protein